MVKKGNWFSSIKKTLSPSSKQKKSQKEEHPSAPSTSVVENAGGSGGSRSFPPPEEVTPLVVEAEPPQAVSRAPAAVSAAAGAAAKSQYSGISREEVAAVRIQTVFRGYLARRALWGLRGLVRLKTVVDGPSVKRQTANTLKYTRSLSHLQYQISSRRIRMLEENQARQKQLQLAKEMASLQNGDDWNDSVQSKEEVEAKLLSKHEATMRRERAMAYSFSHQRPWKKASGTTHMLFMDPANPQWGWSWSERYYKEPVTDHASVKTGINITRSEIAKSYARHQLNSAPTTPRSKPKPKPGPSPRAFGSGLEANVDDDVKSVTSVKSERNDYRRRSVGSMVAAKSAKAKTQTENGGAKKQLSFPAKPRRHSGPPKVETSVFNGLEHTSAE
ncbi:protein IQ-DOMAIN 2-like isoform X2 [Bidens hawaiensis]|uniref:protein IQ-DOMAIN 2-like isoform X2 n=1 Tax=Bidens hawaiensis TaxID=980011 RepID=UPI00404971BE